jgi:hypothetical protein
MEMRKINSGLSYCVLQATGILLVLVFITISLSGCTYKTYTGDIGNATFSFQFRKNDCVNPPDEFLGDFDPPRPLPEGCSYYPDSHINIDIYDKNPYIYNAEMSLEDFIYSLLGNDYLRDLEVRERGTVIIAGMTAEYANYFYTGYTTVPLYYEGKVASFVYGDYIVDIDVLFMEGNLDTDIAFNLIVDTFTINE